jgi:hypothetical protein
VVPPLGVAPSPLVSKTSMHLLHHGGRILVSQERVELSLTPSHGAVHPLHYRELVPSGRFELPFLPSEGSVLSSWTTRAYCGGPPPGPAIGGFDFCCCAALAARCARTVALLFISSVSLLTSASESWPSFLKLRVTALATSGA